MLYKDHCKHEGKKFYIYQIIFVERVSDYCLLPNVQLFSYIMGTRSYIWRDDNDIFFVHDQHA